MITEADLTVQNFLQKFHTFLHLSGTNAQKSCCHGNVLDLDSFNTAGTCIRNYIKYKLFFFAATYYRWVASINPVITR